MMNPEGKPPLKPLSLFIRHFRLWRIRYSIFAGNLSCLVPARPCQALDSSHEMSNIEQGMSNDEGHAPLHTKNATGTPSD